MRNKVNITLSFFRKGYYSEKLEEHKNDLKGTWKVLKYAMGQGSKTTNVDKITEKRFQYTDNKEIVDICNKHFVSIGGRLAEGIPDTSDSPTAHMKPTNCRFVFRKVTTSQVERVIKKLVNAKTTGAHNIPNKILKDSCQTIAPFFSDIFNFSISTNTFPNDLKIGKVSPAHKSGDRDNLNNHRPISAPKAGLLWNQR